MIVAKKELRGMLTDGWLGCSPDFYHTSGQYINEATGATALHALVGQRVRAKAVQNFLTFYENDPEKKPNYLLRQTKLRGITALHVALYRNSWDVVEIVESLLKAAPELAAIPMHCGMYPLHLVCCDRPEDHHNHNMRSEDCAALIPMLLKHYPAAATARGKYNGGSITPLEILCQKMSKFSWARLTLNEMGSPQQQEARAHTKSALLLAKAEAQPETMTWQKLCLLLLSSFLLLQMILVTLKPEEVADLGDFQQPDQTGKLPLHHCCAVVDEYKNNTTPLLVPVVLGADPQAATHCDDNGRLPLHIGVENRNISPESMLTLARAYPEALTRIDPVSRLYPVQKLASETCGSDDSVTDAVYVLLRMNPTVVNLY